MEDQKDIIARNLAEYRKLKGLTQLELAELLSYSDKAVSKWERGESLPDILVFKQLADLYGITVDDFFLKERKKNNIMRLLTKHRLIIPMLAAGIAWLVATIVFTLCMILDVWPRSWLCFIYAIPISLIVLLVFNAIWGNKVLSAVLVSFLTWTIALALTLSIKTEGIYALYLICIPCQVMVVLWYIMRVKRTKRVVITEAKKEE